MRLTAGFAADNARNNTGEYRRNSAASTPPRAFRAWKPSNTARTLAFIRGVDAKMARSAKS